MPKTTTTKHKSTSFYLSVPVNDYLDYIAKMMYENKSQVINRLIIQEYTRMERVFKDEGLISDSDPDS